jgi:hypothetical protein
MDAQLRLIPRPEARRAATRPGARTADTAPGEAPEAPAQWRIDDGARQRGREGISRAREALQQARQPLPAHRHTTAA